MLLDFKNLFIKYNMNISGVIHIGAHYGEEHSLYKELKITNINYFEPLNKNFNILKNNIKDSNLYNFALGEKETTIEMFVEENNNGQSSSILEPKLHLQQYPHIIFNKKEIVNMRTLDSFNINNCNLINIDVQGYELNVFKGGINTLNNIDYIITEVNNDEVYKNCSKINDLDLFLENFHFKRVETTWDGITWGDALYIKKGVN